MSQGVNKVTLLGNLGADPEIRYMPSGDAIANLNVATSSSWKDRQTGERKEHTEWHRVVLNKHLAELARDYLKKGSKVYLEGSNFTRKWTGQDGIDRYTTEVRCRELQMLDRKESGDAKSNPSKPAQPSQRQKSAQPKAEPVVSGGGGGMSDYDDDIPFARLHYLEGG
jgi:single-strand DNA-binding protein